MGAQACVFLPECDELFENVVGLWPWFAGVFAKERGHALTDVLGGRGVEFPPVQKQVLVQGVFFLRLDAVFDEG